MVSFASRWPRVGIPQLHQIFAFSRWPRITRLRCVSSWFALDADRVTPGRTATVFVTIPAIAAKLFLAIRQEAPERDLDRFAEAVTADATKQHLSRNARARAK